MDYYVMSPEEAIVWLDTKGIRYEVCDTPIPIMGNKLNCGITLGIGDEMIEGYYYLPKSAVGLHPQMEVPAQGDSMIDAGIEEGDLLRLEIGALPCDGDIVMAEIDGEATVKATHGDDARLGTRGPRNLLELLPDEFTIDDARRVRQQEGLGTENTMKMIRNWVNRMYVTQNSEFSFIKSKKYVITRNQK